MTLYDDEVWPLIEDDDLWIFDKLILSRKLGNVCGPTGVPVPSPNRYVVRPCVNLMGMSKGVSIEHIDNSTDHLPAGYFWQEVFEGRHLSVDYKDGHQILCTQGFSNTEDVTKFDRWVVTDDTPNLPDLIKDIVVKYPTVNIEMIGGKIIEVHLRGNSDFVDGATEIIPLWKREGYTFVDDPDGDRIGFFKKY